jgi:hypothetical protein
MRTYTPRDFERTQSVISYTLASTPERLHKCEARLRDLRYRLNYDGFCMNLPVMAELDYHTPGDRGLGRLSTEVPRLGGHCRKSLAQLRVLVSLRGRCG